MAGMYNLDFFTLISVVIIHTKNSDKAQTNTSHSNQATVLVELYSLWSHVRQFDSEGNSFLFFGSYALPLSHCLQLILYRCGLLWPIFKEYL